MKLMCIMDEEWWDWNNHCPTTGPMYGEIVTVIGTETDAWDRFCYFLAEHPGDSYTADLFIPLSEIDETEIVREYNVVTNL